MPHDHDHDHDHAPGQGDERRDAAAAAGVRSDVDPARYDGIVGHVIRKTSACGRELLAVVPRQQFEAALDKAAASVARRVTVKGFRPGRTPVARVKAMHRTALEREAMETLVSHTFQAAAAEAKVTPVASPRLTELDAKKGQPIRFAATFEVLPEVEIRGLDEIRVTDRVVKVTDADVDAHLEALRSLRAKLVPAERRDASPGGFAVVNLARFAADAAPDAPPEDSREGLVVEVGAPGNPEALDRALLGMEPGEVRTFTLSFPAEHPDAKLAGRAIRHRVELVGLRERVVPPLDDQLAKQLGGHESVEALRATVRENVIEERRRRAGEERDREIIEQVLARNPLELPQALVEQEADARLRKGLERLAAQGVDLDSARIDWAAELQRARQGAERDLKADFLVALAARAKSVDVSEAEVSAAIAQLAASAGKTPAAMKSELQKSRRMSELKGTLVRRRVLDLLGSGATIRVE